MSVDTEDTEETKNTVDTEEESVTESEPDGSGSDSELDEQLSGGDPLKCRMYQSDYPAKGDLVIVEVKKIVEMGAYCNLLEYNNLEGTNPLSALCRYPCTNSTGFISEYFLLNLCCDF